MRNLPTGSRKKTSRGDDFIQERGIGSQLERFDKIIQREGGNISAGLVKAMRGTLSIADRAKYDVSIAARKTTEAIESALEAQIDQGIRVTSERGKFLVDRTIKLTEQLLEADLVEAKAITTELKFLRKQTKSLAGVEREAVKNITGIAVGGMREIGSKSLIKAAVLENIPRMEDFVENILGGGFIGKTAGSFIRLRKERKQRRIADKAAIASRSVEQETNDEVKTINETVSRIHASMQSSREDEEEKKRQQEDLIESIDGLADTIQGSEEYREREGKEEKSLISKLLGGLGGMFSSFLPGLGFPGRRGRPSIPPATGKAGRFGKFFGRFGRAGRAVGGVGRFAARRFPLALAALEGFNLFNAVRDIKNDPTLSSREKSRATQVQVGKSAGGIGGTLAGTALGAKIGLLGGPLAPLTVPLGAILGGSLGYMSGGKAGEFVTKKAQDLIGNLKTSFGKLRTVFPVFSSAFKIISGDLLERGKLVGGIITSVSETVMKEWEDEVNIATGLITAYGTIALENLQESIASVWEKFWEKFKDLFDGVDGDGNPKKDRDANDPNNRVPSFGFAPTSSRVESGRFELLRQQDGLQAAQIGGILTALNTTNMNAITQVFSGPIKTRNDHNTIERLESTGFAFA
jgi:hypothetical protein